MKYYLDTEFHEYHKQPKVLGIRVGKPIPTIDLISIGIVSEDIQREVSYGGDTEDLKKSITNREYYAICKDFNLVDAWYANQGTKKEPNYWLRDHVLINLYKELHIKHLGKPINIEPEDLEEYEIRAYMELKFLINKYGKTKKQIAEEILEFINEDIKVAIKETNTTFKGESSIIYESKPEFYAYCADYDWVVFTQLFGTMMDLPKGFPMYCKDLKQELDNLNRPDLKTYPNYPKQDNEHNALADVKWNKKLHKFLNTIQ